MSDQPETSGHVGSSREALGKLAAVLGWLQAAILLLMASYLLNVYYTLSDIPPMNQLFIEILVSACLLSVSAVTLVVGSFLMWKTRPEKSSVPNLLAGILIPVPAFVYFTFLSKPSLLGWLLSLLGPVSFFLLAPGILGGIIGIYIRSQPTASPTPSS